MYDGHGSWVNAQNKLFSEPVKNHKMRAIENGQRNRQIIKDIVVRYGRIAQTGKLFVTQSITSRKGIDLSNTDELTKGRNSAA